MKYVFPDLRELIIQAVREKAGDVPCFKEKREGTILVALNATCLHAWMWAGRSAESYPGDNRDIRDIVEAVSIHEEGFQVAFHKKDDGSVRKVSTLSMATMKLAQLDDMEDPDVLVSGVKANKDHIPENGYCPEEGCIVIEASRTRASDCGSKGAEPELFCRIYVSVAGASPKEDFETALAALKPVVECFDDENYKLVYYSDKA